MAEIFVLPPLFGFSQTIKYEHSLINSVNNHDSIVAKHDEPIIEYNYSASLLTETEKDYAKSFFTARNGSQDLFLFYDPMDNYATNTEYDTGYEIKTRGVVLQENTTYFLAKAYYLFIDPVTYVIYRPITRPKAIVTVYDDLGVEQTVTIDYDTGVIISGGAVNQYWTGEFYVPVRFQSDTMPITVESFKDPDDIADYNRYKIPDLRFVEIKESPYRINQIISTSYEHNYNIPFEKDTAIDHTSKTDIFKNEADIEIRESLNVYRYVISQSNQLLLDKKISSYNRKEYLIGLYRLCLGNAIPIRIVDDIIGFNHFFRFDSDISFEMTAYDDSEPALYAGKFTVNNLNFKQFLGTTSFYCHCWLITRSDATVIAITNFNRPVTISGQTYYPTDAIASVSATSTAELNIDNTDAKGAMGIITEIDLVAGKYDNATVDYFMADWYLQTKIVSLFEGTIGGYSIAYLNGNAKTFELECLSQTEVFDKNIVRLTSSTCHYRFTSSKCGVPITTAVQESTTVVSASGDTITTAQSTTGYEGGELEFTSGDMVGRRIPIVDVSGNDVILLYPPEIIPSNGDTIQITRRCGKTAGDCNSYGNIANFGGQPLYPTTDSKISGADNS